MLTRIEIDGFKSFTNFSMEFSPLTIVAGLNASGKSNLFDALHLLSLLAEYDLNTAFREVQRGSNLELFTQYEDERNANEMRFAVELFVSSVYTGRMAISQFRRFRYEISIVLDSFEKGAEKLIIAEKFNLIPYHEDGWAKKYAPYLVEIDSHRMPTSSISTIDGNRYVFDMGLSQDLVPTSTSLTVYQDYKASIISLVKLAEEFPHILAAQQEFRSWKLPRLDPKKLSDASLAQAFGLPSTLNSAADNLAGVIWRLEKTDPYLVKRIAQRLASLVPGIKELEVTYYKYGGVYEVWVHTTAGQRFPLHLLSEGTLRLLALCTLAFDDQQHGVLGLEEPENGVHPGLLKRVAELLRDLSTNEAPEEGQEPWPLRQVIVNTHSPGLIKACLETAAGQEGGGKSNLTVWFSQLVSRPVEEKGKRVSRRVTKMLPVVLPKIQPSEAVTAELGESEKRVTLGQLLHYLNTAATDPLLRDLGLSVEPSTPRD